MKEFFGHIDAERCVDTLRELVSRYSESGNEAKVGEYVLERLAACGLQVEKQSVSDTSFNVIGRLSVPNPSYTAMFSGHLDTVSIVNGWTRDPLSLEVDGDRLYGLGAADMKGGICAVLEMLRAMKESGITPAGDIVVAFFVDEEGFSRGARLSIDRGIKADFCILCEPHFDEVVVGWPGKTLLRCLVQGKTAHGSTPWEGVNAIDEAASLIVGLSRLTGLSHPELGAHPYVVLSVRGGAEKYSLSVPDTCEIVISKQTVPGETKEVLLDAVGQVKDESLCRGKAVFEIGDPYYPPAEISRDHPIVEGLLTAFRKVTGRIIHPQYGKGVCDGNLLVGQQGIPTVCFGPSGGPIHAPDEWVSLEQIIVAARVYGTIALNGVDVRE